MGSLSLEDQQHFHMHGFVVVVDVLSQDEIALLRNEADDLRSEAELDELDLIQNLGCILEPLRIGEPWIPHKLDYLEERRRRLTEGYDILYGAQSRLIPLARQLLPQEQPLHLFNEQYICKPARSSARSAFGWHQDNEYMSQQARGIPNIALWLALDDMNNQNGCLKIRPFERNIDLETVPLSELHNSITSYTKWHSTAAPSTKVIDFPVSAGTLVVLSAFVSHCSGPNTTSKDRLALMPQFSCGPVIADGQPVGLSVRL